MDGGRGKDIDKLATMGMSLCKASSTAKSVALGLYSIGAFMLMRWLVFSEKA